MYSFELSASITLYSNSNENNNCEDKYENSHSNKDISVWNKLAQKAPAKNNKRKKN